MYIIILYYIYMNITSSLSSLLINIKRTVATVPVTPAATAAAVTTATAAISTASAAVTPATTTVSADIADGTAAGATAVEEPALRVVRVLHLSHFVLCHASGQQKVCRQP